AIDDPHFPFNRKAPGLAPDDCIPGSKVTRPRERNLNMPTEAGVEAHSESLKKPVLPRVPERVARRVEPQGQLEPDDRRNPAQRLDRRSAQHSALDPAQLGVRNPSSGGNSALTQPGRTSCLRKLTPSPQNKLSTRSDPLLGSRSPRWHEADRAGPLFTRSYPRPLR